MFYLKIFTMKKIYIISLVSLLFFNRCGNQSQQNNDMNKEFTDFIAKYEAKAKPLIKEMNIASFKAAVSGNEEDYKKAAELEFKLSKIFSDKNDFAILKKIKESGEVKDSLLARELKKLYNTFLSQQVDTVKTKAMIDLQSKIAKAFNTFRAQVNGKQLTDNDIEELLTTSTNNNDLKAAWFATKKSGEVVSQDILKLVKLRNEVAKELGFKNYHEMSLTLSDQDPQEITKLFDELDNLTKGAFSKCKDEMDEYFVKRYKIKKDELMPWHYQNRFFQEAPKIYKVDIDGFYKDKDLVEITKKYYESIGLSITDLLPNCDLYEKPGKNQHAFESNIDYEGDIRVLCNVKPNAKWMNTLMHEFGHASYDKYIDRKLPITLREPAHIFTTEAIAMMFGRFASNPQWIKDNIGIDEKEKNKIESDCFNSLRLEMLTFSRWAQVMYRFEKNMYDNPDQDLNKLWWDLVEKYQMVKRPVDRNAPDWASKVHFATAPCYYHNYLLGELLASQLYYTIVDKVIKSNDYKNQSFTNNKEVGNFLKDKVLGPGAKYYWNDMIEKATGEKLSAKFYAKQFVD
jgi:peptidyl-dipeptidase A